MANVDFFWTWEPGDNVEHIAEHGLTPEDVENAHDTVETFAVSRSSGRSAFRGLAIDGRHIFVVYEEIDATTWYVVTAYEVQR